MQNSWSEYYQYAKEKYGGSETRSIYDLTLEIWDPNVKSIFGNEDGFYFYIIEQLSKKINICFKDKRKYSRSGLCHELNDIWKFKTELQILSRIIKPKIEREIYNSHVHIDNIKIYRNYITDEKESSSWLWHFDCVPKEQNKVLIYLTDVLEPGSGEFEVLFYDKNPIKVPTSRVSYENWVDPWDSDSSYYLKEFNLEWKNTDRIPQSILKTLVEKSKIGKVLGKKGKMMLFDNNIIHRATPSRKTFRDVIVLTLKPSIDKIKVTENNCGNGSRHTSVNIDPTRLKPLIANADNNIINQRKRYGY